MGNRRVWKIIDGGPEIKASLLWDEETDAWQYYSNAPFQQSSHLYRTIPTLYRGIEIIANEVQNVPLTVYDASGNEIDNTKNWRNAVKVLPNPRRMFGLISQALDRHGKAYLMASRNRAGVVKELRWLSPLSIEPVFDQASGELLRFVRTIGTRVFELAPQDIIYFWLPDSDIEQGPPQSWPLRAALQAAGVLCNLDAYINTYFERGAIRPIIVSARGIPSPQERERLQTWFNRLMGGIRRAFRWEVFNADALTFQQIGDGIDQLQNQTLTEDQRRDIALAIGVPQTILFANSANYATSLSDMRNFYNMTVVPRCEFIAETLNVQLFERAGYHIEPSPESLDIYQEDENQRSQALAALTGAGVPLLMAMDILGYDLTPEQRAELERKEPEAGPEVEPEPEPELEAAPVTPAPEIVDEEKHWRRLANRALRDGRPMPIDFIPDHIPSWRAAQICRVLRDAKTGGDIKAAFEQPYVPPSPSDDLALLASELLRANNLLEAVMGAKS